MEPLVNLREIAEIELFIVKRMKEFTVGDHASVFGRKIMQGPAALTGNRLPPRGNAESGAGDARPWTE